MVPKANRDMPNTLLMFFNQFSKYDKVAKVTDTDI